jgi:hypothetical protein
MIASFLGAGSFPVFGESAGAIARERGPRRGEDCPRPMVLALDNPDLSGRPRLSLGSLRLTAEAQKYPSQTWRS